MQRVVISGIGLVGPTGNTVSAFWRSVVEGQSGIDRITRFDPTSYASQIGGEVRDRGYENLIDPRKLRTTPHVTHLALAAAELALRDARLPAQYYESSAIGVSIGTAVGGWREAGQQISILNERGARRVNPFIASGAAPHGPGVEVACAIGACGPQLTYANGCPSGLQAIGSGAALVESEELDLCLAGGAESPLMPLVFAGLTRTQELSTLNDRPAQASRPFDRDHAGMVLSEGSCFLVLERKDRVLSRGGKVYAEVMGFAGSCDASGLYETDASGEPGARAIHRALSRSGLEPSAIDYVCAHANSAAAFDRKEAIIINRAFGSVSARLPVSSIKGVVGHMFGASGPFQAAAAALAMQHDLIPPTHNLETPAPECDLHLVAREARSQRVGATLVTSYGYGGVNAYLILGKPKL